MGNFMSIEFDNLKQKHKNILNKKIWYHGTLDIYLDSLSEKIISNHNIGSELDFGPGFYLAPTFEIASRFIKQIFEYQKDFFEEEVKPIVIEVELSETVTALIENGSKFIAYPNFDENFAEFILINRLEPLKKIHNYDLIYGVMSDSNPLELIPLYKNGIISKDEFIQEIVNKRNSSKQLSIHNQGICDKINVINHVYV